MKRFFALLSLLTAFAFFSGDLVFAGPEKDPLKARVPAKERGKAKKLKPPANLYKKAKKASAEIVAEGKKLFEGKGTCVNCHGKAGDGKGEAGKVLTPGPRDFTFCKFHKKRKDGELFWIIKNGSPGTGMVAMIPATITEEEGWKTLAYERSFCKKYDKYRK